MKRFFLIILLMALISAAPSNRKVKTLYNSLNPHSIPQHLALYDLYPNHPEGKRALQDAWALLSGSRLSPQSISIPYPQIGIEAIVALVNKQPNEATPDLSPEELEVIERLAEKLPNRLLKGHRVTSEAEVVGLPFDQVDLARGLFLSQFSQEPNHLQKLRSYEAVIDLMALQLLTKISLNSSPEEKVHAINSFIFEEMRFRFPPHSTYAKDIDLYTFLPCVLDSRRGVCLGVSILYLCLAQRLNLSLEMITPPGHIYVRYSSPDKVINIETTARGIDAPTEMYLGVETRSLQQRNIKEVIGLAHFNQASTYWQNGSYEKAVASYEIAQKYLPDDMLLKELLGYNYLFIGQKEKGEALLQEVKDYLPEHAIIKQTFAEDYLNGNVDAEGIKAFFTHVDETRDSLLKKRDALQAVVHRYPQFRNGVQSLAVTWLQLHRAGEALELLKQFHQLDPNDPTVEYYLAILYAQRIDFKKSWEHLRQAEAIVLARQHNPKAIKELRKMLASHCPE